MIRKDSARAIIENGGGGILLVQEGRNGPFGLPGGKPESGESWIDGGLREVLEETGLAVVFKHIVGIYTEIPTKSGNNVTDIVFTAEQIAGEIVTSRGHPQVDFFHPRLIRSMHKAGQLRSPRVHAALTDYWKGRLYPIDLMRVMASKPNTDAPNPR